MGWLMNKIFNYFNLNCYFFFHWILKINAIIFDEKEIDECIWYINENVLNEWVC